MSKQAISMRDDGMLFRCDLPIHLKKIFYLHLNALGGWRGGGGRLGCQDEPRGDCILIRATEKISLRASFSPTFSLVGGLSLVFHLSLPLSLSLT